MVFNTTFNNISVISRRPVLLLEEIGSTLRKLLYHIMLYQVYLACVGFELATLVVIGTDCTGCCKSNYYTITTTKPPI